MHENALLELASHADVLFGSFATGFFAWLLARDQKRFRSMRKTCTNALKDVATYHRLEAEYVSELAHLSEKPAETWKKEKRRLLREEFDLDLSSDATETSAFRKLKTLE